MIVSNQYKMKDSGVPWIGEIPEHWEVKRLKYVLNERNERSVLGLEPLFMVRSEYHEKAEVSQSNIGNKLVQENESNINFVGSVSPDYAVYYSNGVLPDLKYLKYIEEESSKIDKAINLLQQQIEKIREYKIILINNAETGKIRISQ